MAEGSHAGRPSSWIAVGVMVAGSAAGGLGLVTGPLWPLFWVGVAITALGGVLALAVGILSDVVVYAPSELTTGASPGAPAAVAATAGTDDTKTRS
jgi:ABC-type transport system involved in cytochrome c biogenesis permease subunit